MKKNFLRIMLFSVFPFLVLSFPSCLFAQVNSHCCEQNRCCQDEVKVSNVIVYLLKTENSDVETREEYNELLFYFLISEPLNSIQAISELSSAGFAQILTEILNPVNDNIDIALALNSIRECTTKYDAIREVLVEILGIVLSKSNLDQRRVLVLDQGRKCPG